MKPILLSGRPGAGKSHFAKWLQSDRGFARIETDNEPQGSKWWTLVNGARSPEGAAAMRNEAQALGSKVVIEWGFPPEAIHLARRLRDAGFDAWWLDCGEEAAFYGYINARRNLSPQNLMQAILAFEVQTEKIRKAWPQLESFYGNHIINTVISGPSYVSYAEIASRMLPDDAEG